METRRLGRTEHHSSVLIFGAAALWSCSQEEADAAVAQALDALPAGQPVNTDQRPSIGCNIKWKG